MKAREVMVKAPVTLPVDATIHEAATVMDGAAVGAIVILDGTRPVGLVTDRDLVTRALAQATPARRPGGRGDEQRRGEHRCRRRAVRGLVDPVGSSVPPRAGGGARAHRGMVTLDDLIVRLANELHNVTKGVTAQLLFGRPEPRPGDVVIVKPRPSAS